MVRTLDLAKRTAILSAAKSIFARDGYSLAKISDIAAEAGIAPGTLYLYFENKEALASVIGEEFLSGIIAQFGSVIRKIKDPKGVVSLVEWGLQIADEDRDVLAMVKERRQDRKSKNDGRRRFLAEIADSLLHLMSSGVIRQYNDVTILADLVLALMRRIIMSHALFENDNTDELKAGAVVVLQHVLFDDVTLAASRLLRAKRGRKV
jgi:TetR/AcrR family transcriptional regulator, fatty acid metabolism regulator protein